MNHYWVIDENSKIKAIGNISEFICSNCKMLAFGNNKILYVYTSLNGFAWNEDVNNIICEEFIIKSIIE